jgi:hypothetical protein
MLKKQQKFSTADGAGDESTSSGSEVEVCDSADVDETAQALEASLRAGAQAQGALVTRGALLQASGMDASQHRLEIGICGMMRADGQEVLEVHAYSIGIPCFRPCIHTVCLKASSGTILVICISCARDSLWLAP